jgi:heptosyltransferase-2
MVTPAFENLTNFLGSPEVILIGSDASIEILKNHKLVKKSILVNKNYLSLLKISKSIGRFDFFFSFRGSIRSTIFKFMISSNKKFQYKAKDFINRHQVEKYNDFVNKSLQIKILAGELYKDEAFNLAFKDKIKKVGLNPGASYGSSKRWYPSEFANVAFELSSRYEILIFGGPNELDIANEIERILLQKGVKNYKNLAGRTNLNELIDYISKLSLFITGDSGPMHIAASFKIPTVTIFGPTNENETSQWMNERGVNIKQNLDCRPCMKRECPLKHHDCMKLVKSDDVLKAIESVI